MANRTTYRPLFVGLLGALGFGCSAPKMQVPADISARSEVLVATDRSAMSGSLADESFKLGPYAVKDVDRKWDSGSGFSIGGVSKSSTEGGYEFKLEGRGKKEVGHCMTEKKDTGVSLGSGFGMEFAFSKLACACDGGAKQATVVITSESNKFTGPLVTSDGSYQVRSIHEIEGGTSMDKPTGYRMDGDSGVAAAEVQHPGRVWLDKKLSDSEKAEVACLFVGLMLYKPKEEH